MSTNSFYPYLFSIVYCVAGKKWQKRRALSASEHVRVRVNCIKLMRIHFMPRPNPANPMPFKSRFNLIFIVVS